jgi:H+/Cl- antiporter ClcA
VVDSEINTNREERRRRMALFIAELLVLAVCIAAGVVLGIVLDHVVVGAVVGVVVGAWAAWLIAISSPPAFEDDPLFW